MHGSLVGKNRVFLNNIKKRFLSIVLISFPGIILSAMIYLSLFCFPVMSFSATPNRIPAVNNCTFWALGVDYAWNNWGTDFGTGYNQATMQSDFDAMYNAGVRSVRWWVFTDFGSSPLWSGTGKGSTCTGLPANWVANLTAAANYANSKGMKIYFTLSSFDMAYPVGYNGRTFNHDDVITSTAIRASFLKNAVAPIAAALATNAGVMGWDIVNEPEWMIQASDNGGANAALEQMSLANVRAYVHDMAATLHLSVKQPVSVGSACMKWCGKDYDFWSGQGLDFFDFHYYDWMTQWYNPAAIAVSALNYHTDNGKPVIIGESMGNPVTEYSGPGSPGFTHQQMATALYNNGYAGYMAWAWHGNDNISANTGLINPSYKNFATAVGLQYLVCPSGTSTFTPTPTPTNTPSRTPSNTPTKTVANTATNSPTRTATASPTRTATVTSTSTPANTATNSPTATPSRTPTPTNTNTVGNTATNTPSRTPSSTPSNTPSPTITRTATNSPSTTPSNTGTKTPTATSTNTVGNTMTASNTPTPSPTRTPSSTPSDTPSPTITRTATNSPSTTPSNTGTRTPTPTYTNTVGNTMTVSNTPTTSPTRTPSSTPSDTPSPTITRTATNSPSATPSNTGTRTPTPTSTNTVGNTMTASNTPTTSPTRTPSSTPSDTPTSTASATASRTPTNTTTNTPTKTGTSTPTNTASATPTRTPTNSPTVTPLFTATFTATTVTVQISAGTSMPSNSTQLPGTSNVPVLQFQLNNPGISNVTLTSLTLSAMGSGNDGTGISSVSLYVDTNGNGIVDGSDTLLGTATYSGNNGTAVFNFTNSVPSNGSKTYLVVDNFTGTANGTFQTQVTNVTDLSGTNGTGPVNFNGAPLTGAVLTLSAATATVTNTLTPTNSPTSSFTPSVTKSFTPTKTNTPTFTNTASSTPTATVTATSSATRTFTPVFTATSTPKGKPTPIVYPNPAPGGTVNILPPATNGPSDVTVKIYTVAFRKVVERTYENIPSGTAVPLELADRWGTPLASGLYYVVVDTNTGRSTGKLIILR